MEHKINDVVYMVTNYNIVRGKIITVINTTTIEAGKEKVKTEYELLCVDNKKRKSSGAYLVSTIEKAIESATTNWKQITKDVEEMIAKTSDEIFDQVEKDSTSVTIK